MNNGVLNNSLYKLLFFFVILTMQSKCSIDEKKYPNQPNCQKYFILPTGEYLSPISYRHISNHVPMQFRYATPCELLMTAFGLVFGTIASFGIPWNVVTYGEFTTMLVDRTVGGNVSSTPTYLLDLFGGGKIL